MMAGRPKEPSASRARKLLAKLLRVKPCVKPVTDAC